MYFKVSSLTSQKLRIKKKFGGLETVIREIETKEGLRFLSHKNKLSLVATLYLGIDKKSQRRKSLNNWLYNITTYKDLSLKEKLVNALIDLTLNIHENEHELCKDLSMVTGLDVLKTITYLKIYTGMWFSRSTFFYILKGDVAVKYVKRYRKKGATKAYHYLDVLEDVLSSFNLATSFSLDLWWGQIRRELKPTQVKVLRITAPGALFLDAYSNFKLGGINIDVFRQDLLKIITLPSLMLKVAEEAVNRLAEVTLQSLTLEVKDAISSHMGDYDVRPYMNLIASDLSNLLVLYTMHKLDSESLLKKMLVRWKQ